MPADRALLAAVREALQAQADPARGIQQQRYMKSAMPYYGLATPALRATLRPLLKVHVLPDQPTWRDTALTLWDEATHREERYATLSLLRHRRYNGWAADPAMLDDYAALVRSASWWDLVDEIASHLVGDVLAAHPSEVTPVMRTWAHDPHLWIRRTAIICQLSRGAATDTRLLREAITASLHDTDFFARKAIGWALRQYARTDPAWVRQTVDELHLTGLSRREALKHLT